MTTSTPVATSHLRAADSDRHLAVATLKDHYVAGRLTAHELGERIARALAAQTHGDLAQILGDLPPALAPSGASAAAPPVRATSPHRHSALRRGLAPHAASYAAVMTLLLAIWLLTTPGGYFWPVWPMLGWGIGLAKHAIFATFGSGMSLPFGAAAGRQRSRLAL